MSGGPVLYLHGFASSPKSSKARYFHDRFTELGLPIEILDLTEGDFEHLTISGQLRIIERAATGRGATLIGSSLGGYLAALYAARHPEVDRLVLMAPAFRFPVHWPATLGPQRMEEWARSRKLTVYHYADGMDRELDYGFYEDGIRYEAEPDFRQPALILHGRHDTVVPVEFSESFAQERANVSLELFDSGHELTDVLAPMWDRVRSFLELHAVPDFGI